MQSANGRVPHPRRVFVFAARVGKPGLRDITAAILFATFGFSALAGCGMPGAPQPPSLNLPNRVTDLSAVRTGDQVALTWSMPKRNTDKMLLTANITARICRNQVVVAPCAAVATLQLAPDSDGTFTDVLPPPLAAGPPHLLTYFVELDNRKGRSAGLSNGASVLAGEAPPAISGLTAAMRPGGVLLSWTPAPPGSSPVAIRLERKLLTLPTKKPSSGSLAEPDEPCRILFAKIAHEARDHNAISLGFAAQAECELHRRTEQVVMDRHRLAGVDADPHPQTLGCFGVVRGKMPLNIRSGADRIRNFIERGHDPVAGVLHLAPAVGGEPASDQRIVHSHQLERRGVAEPHRQLGRANDVGEQDCAQPGIHFRGRGARSRPGIADAAEERLDRGEIDRDNVGCDFAMRLAVGARQSPHRARRRGRSRCSAPRRTSRSCI